MIDVLSLSNSGVFIASLGVTCLLCIVEGVALAFAGTTTPSFTDLGDSDHPASGPLSYLNAGNLPLTLFVASAAAMFGMTGLGIQQAALALTGETLPMLAVIPLAAIAATPATHFVSRGLGALLPKTESSAISNEDLIGCEGEVMAGTGKRGQPVQVKLRDEHDQSHYIMVEPLRDDDILTQGQSVLITARDGAQYLAIRSVIHVKSGTF